MREREREREKERAINIYTMLRAMVQRDVTIHNAH